MTVAPDQSGETRFLIGVDASRSVTPQPTGTELYSRCLIEALLDRAPDRFFFRLYFNRAPQSAVSGQRSAREASGQQSESYRFRACGRIFGFPPR